MVLQSRRAAQPAAQASVDSCAAESLPACLSTDACSSLHQIAFVSIRSTAAAQANSTSAGAGVLLRCTLHSATIGATMLLRREVSTIDRAVRGWRAEEPTWRS